MAVKNKAKSDRAKFKLMNLNTMMEFIDDENPWFFKSLVKYARNEAEREVWVRERNANNPKYGDYEADIFKYVQREKQPYWPEDRPYEDHWIIVVWQLKKLLNDRYIRRIPQIGIKREEKILESLRRLCKKRGINWAHIWCEQCRRFL